MMYKGIVILYLFVVNLGYGQTKKELEDQIIRLEKTIDSLKNVNANLENVVESRDRTIKFLREDTAQLSDDIQTLYAKIRGKNEELVRLRNETRTGVAKMTLLANNRNSLTVPEGKTWIINQFVTDYVVNLHTDSLGNVVGEELFVFLKSLNGEILTDPAQGLYGPMLYSSMHPEYTMRFPIVLPAGTKYQVILYQGTIGALTAYDGKIFVSYFEKDA